MPLCKEVAHACPLAVQFDVTLVHVLARYLRKHETSIFFVEGVLGVSVLSLQDGLRPTTELASTGPISYISSPGLTAGLPGDLSQTNVE
jgi:hypothetical protein